MRTKLYNFFYRLTQADVSKSTIAVAGAFFLLSYLLVPEADVHAWEYAAGFLLGCIILVYILATLVHLVIDEILEVVILYFFKREKEQLEAEEWQFLEHASKAVAAMPADRQEYYWNLLWHAMRFDHPIAKQDRVTDDQQNARMVG